VRWLSGRKRFFAKEVNSKGFRGFESHSRRHSKGPRHLHSRWRFSFEQPARGFERSLSLAPLTICHLASPIPCASRRGRVVPLAAKQYSYDLASTKGGDRGWVKRGQLPADLPAAAFALKAG
jgi:hypothetical protein